MDLHGTASSLLGRSVEAPLCDPSKGPGRVLARVPSETLAWVTKRCMQGAL